MPGRRERLDAQQVSSTQHSYSSSVGNSAVQSVTLGPAADALPINQSEGLSVEDHMHHSLAQQTEWWRSMKRGCTGQAPFPETTRLWALPQTELLPSRVVLCPPLCSLLLSPRKWKEPCPAVSQDWWHWGINFNLPWIGTEPQGGQTSEGKWPNHAAKFRSNHWSNRRLALTITLK